MLGHIHAREGKRVEWVLGPDRYTPTYSCRLMWVWTTTSTVIVNCGLDWVDLLLPQVLTD